MRGNKLFLIVISLCVIFTFILLSACGTKQETSAPTTSAAAPTTSAVSTPTQTTPATPIKIGALIPFTGVYAMWGSWFDRSYKFGFEQANYQVAGHPIQLIEADEGGLDISVMTQQLTKLVESDKCNIITGPFAGTMGPAAWPYLADKKIVSVDNHCRDRSEVKYNYMFDGEQAYIDISYYEGKYAYDSMGIKTVSTIGWDFNCGHDFIEGFCTGFTEEGGTVIQQQWTPMGAADYMSYLTAVKPCDGLVTFLPGGSPSVLAINEANQIGLLKKLKGFFITGTAELESPELRTQLGDLGIGVVYSGPWSPLIDNPENKAFVAAFTAKFGEEPGCWDAMKYEVDEIILAALTATNGDTDPDKLEAALLNLKINLPSGPFSFDSGRLGIRSNYIMQIQKVNGQYPGVIVKEIDDTHSRAPESPY